MCYRIRIPIMDRVNQVTLFVVFSSFMVATLKQIFIQYFLDMMYLADIIELSIQFKIKFIII